MPIEQVRGFLDADGSFEAKVYLGTQKPISFHVNIIFSQKDEDVLQAVIDSLPATNSGSQPNKTISVRQIINQSGSTSKGCSISFAFSSDAGQALLAAWVTNPPIAPTKYLDLKICLILAEVSASQTSSAVDVVKKHLNPSSPVNTTDELTAALALLYLRYRMFGKIKQSRNPNLQKIEHYYAQTRATQAQIDLSIQIGQQLLDPIVKDYKNHCQKLETSNQNYANISVDYLLGYHMGDGGFTIQTVFGPNNKTFKSKFGWTLTDCSEQEPLFVAIREFLEVQKVKGLGIQHYRTYNKLVLSNYKSCVALVDLWKSKPLPKAKLNQYDTFVKALDLYDLASFKANLSEAEAFIGLKWSMNPATNSKKAGDLQTELAQIRDWHSKQ